MNAIERLNAFIRGEEPDRLPVYPLMMRQAAHLSSIPYGEYCQDYRSQARAMMDSAMRFGADCVHPSGYPYCEARAYGLEVEYPSDDLPIARIHLIREREDFDKIRAIDPVDFDFMMDRVRGVALFREQMGDELLICGHHEGIMAEYADLRGLGEACMDLFDIPYEIHRYFEIIIENALQWGMMQIEAGAHYMSVGDAACSQIGPDLYREFVFPHHKRLVEAYHKAGAGVKIHICGDISSILPMLIETGADMIDVDHLVQDIKPFVPLLKDHQYFCGNLDPVEIIYSGTPQLIREKAKKWIEDSAGRGILSGGCEIPIHTPVENLEALYSCAEELKSIWLDIRKP